MSRKRHASPTPILLTLLLPVVLLSLFFLSTASNRWVERHYDHVQTQQTSIMGQVSQLNAARHGRGLAPDWLTTLLTVSSSLSLFALASRLALGRDGLSGVLRQLKSRPKTTKKQEAPLRIMHPPPPYEPLTTDPHPELSPPTPDESDPIRWT